MNRQEFFKRSPSLAYSIVLLFSLVIMGASCQPPDQIHTAEQADKFSIEKYGNQEAELKKELAIREKQLGPDHPDLVLNLEKLAMLYWEQDLFDQAELLLKRSLAISEKALGPDHPLVANSLNNLAQLYQERRWYAQAEPLFQRSLAITEKALGPDHRLVAAILGNLAQLYIFQGRYAQAESLLKRSLAISEKALGPDHLVVATSLNNLSAIYYAQGQYAQAESLLKRSLAISEKALGSDHLEATNTLISLAELYQNQGRDEIALPLFQRAFGILSRRIAAVDPDATGSKAEQTSYKEGFLNHVRFLATQAPNSELTNEVFAATQLARVSTTGDMIAQAAARLATGSDELAQKIRERQDATRRLLTLETELLKAVSSEPARRNSEQEQHLRAEIAKSKRRKQELTTELQQRFPAYAELTSPAPLSLADAQTLLQLNEALLTYTVTDDETYLLVIHRQRAQVLRLNAKAKDIQSAVQRLRLHLDPTTNLNIEPFDIAQAHALYQTVFAPALPALDSIRHILLVPDGALGNLPFGVLVAEPLAAAIKIPADHRQAAWLAKRYTFTYLPSVSSLRALRPINAPEQGKDPFIGFGDPILQGHPGTAKGLTLASIFTNRGGIANVNVLRQLPSLPETAEELRAMAQVLEANPNNVIVGVAATETRVKTTDLSQYNIIAFSTHGVMAGELPSVPAEPGLILTPPARATEQDDGYLAASDIVPLKLQANWVILSACNTAAPDGTPGAEGLSGLAKAFFYAGTRALLVSHWSVATEPTVTLITGLLKRYAQYRQEGKAEALRQTMLTLMNDDTHPIYAHPMFWAPFVVAGQ